MPSMSSERYYRHVAQPCYFSLDEKLRISDAQFSTIAAF
jgi:hypothetical protein